jgi:hypothetical protein
MQFQIRQRIQHAVTDQISSSLAFSTYHIAVIHALFYLHQTKFFEFKLHYPKQISFFRIAQDHNTKNPLL